MKRRHRGLSQTTVRAGLTRVFLPTSVRPVLCRLEGSHGWEPGWVRAHLLTLWMASKVSLFNFQETHLFLHSNLLQSSWKTHLRPFHSNAIPEDIE